MIPPPMIGDLGQGDQGQRRAELREQFHRERSRPYGSEFTDEVDAQLIDPAPQWSGLTRLRHDGKMMPDLEALSAAFKDLKRVYTLNELRRMAGIHDLDFEWANQPWMEPGSLPAWRRRERR